MCLKQYVFLLSAEDPYSGVSYRHTPNFVLLLVITNI